MNVDNAFEDWEGRWSHIYKYLEREGPYVQEGWAPGDHLKEWLHSIKVLVIGAGGLGCELLKNLALMGFKDIHVIDMDTIDISNLNRQFLFRTSDVGRPKAEVAAEFIMKRVPGCIVTPYFGKIQDKEVDYYEDFNLVICGLDSIEARRWMNATITGLVVEDDPATMKFMIDGGTEGFKGQSRVIIPRQTSCYECSMDMLTPKATFPICTIANTPRLPEHCIEWASVLQWPKVFPERKIDGDDPEHITWLHNTALDRAKPFGIQGITYSLTKGVIKNIIPAIASTNAIIAAACANEAFKIATSCNPHLDNYMMYVGDSGIYGYTFRLDRKPDCQVCGTESLKLSIKSSMTLQEFIESLVERREFQLKKPSLRSATKTLYMTAPRALEEQTRPNLTKTMKDLVTSGEEISVTDENLPISMQVMIQFEDIPV